MSPLRKSLESLYFGTSDRSQWLLKGLLVPVVPLYKGVRALNQGLRVLRRQQLDVPVLSVGNISLGGTGKTSFVEWLVRQLQDDGYAPAILKRGQGTREGLVEGGDKDSSAEGYGDEVQLLRQALPEVPIGVGSDRYRRGTSLLETHDIDVFVLDDGFQHQQLVRNLDVVLLGSPRELTQWELPAGPLREPVTALERADVISMNVSGLEVESDWEHQLNERVRIREDQVVTRHEYQFDGIYRNGENVTDQYRDDEAHLISTLARPGRLVSFLEEQGIGVGRHLELADHATVDPEEVEGELDPEKILVTDKEWVKLPGELKKTVGRIRSSISVVDGERLLRETRAMLERQHR